jgi:two-component system, LytTR family, response regulator
MSVIRALIVDDEPIARKVLRDELEEFADVMVVGEAGNGHLALGLIDRLKPNLIFLDLEMPALGGIELISRLPDSELPEIIVVSACEACSRIALRAGASGYLLKPVSPRSLRGAIDMVRKRPIGRAASRAESGQHDGKFSRRSDCCH